MHDMPHNYFVTASAKPDGNVTVASPGLSDIESAPPAEFDGPGDLWSPETFLAAAVADCFVLTFRAVAKGFRMEWNSVSCQVEAILDRPDGAMRFTELVLTVDLDVPAGTDETKARRLLDKAEHGCLITNSLTSEVRLNANVQFS